MTTNPTIRSRRAVFLALILGGALLALQLAPAEAATTHTWSAASANWNVATNWTPNGVPANGDQLVFPAAGLSPTNNDLTGLDVDSVAIQGAYAITGNGFTVDTNLSLTGASASIANPITLGGDLTITVTGGASVLTLTGGINLAGHNLIFAGDGTVIVGNISGSGTVTENGSGTVEYHGYGSYGATSINAGTLRAAIDGTNACTAGGLNRLPAAGGVTVASGAILDLQCPVTIAGLSGGGEVRTESTTANLTIAAILDTTFGGIITGPGGLAVTGASLFAQYGPNLSGVSTYTGPTTVTGGGLGLAGGSIASSSGLTVSGGGVVGGVGSIPAASFADALLFPGVLGSPGQVTVPSLTLGLQTTARFVLGGTDLASYDWVMLTGGALNLGGATLDLRTVLGFDPPVGSTYRLIGGAGSVTGTFRDLPEGAVFNRGLQRYSITYKGGTGHDVVITRLTAPPADLSITKTASNASMTPGGTLTFTITASNAGPNDAPMPSVSDTLPAAFLFQSITAPSGWTCNTPVVGQAGAITCQANSIAQNTQAAFSLVVKVATGVSGDVTNGAAISSAAADSATTNNSASVTVRISADARPYRLFAVNVAADGVY